MQINLSITNLSHGCKKFYVLTLLDGPWLHQNRPPNYASIFGLRIQMLNWRKAKPQQLQ